MGKKVVVFGDCHNVDSSYFSTLERKILDLNSNGDLAYVSFLGDLASYEDFVNLLDLKFNLERNGVVFHYVKGNHEQAWIDYIIGRDAKNMLGANDSRMKNNSNLGIEDFLRSFGPHNNDSFGDRTNRVVYYHALPVGDPVSGPHSDIPKYPGRDHRHLYPSFWHYSFNKDGVVRSDVLKSNYEWMRQRGIDYLIKGHEHRNNIFSAGGNLLNILNQATYRVRPGCIIGVGAFSDGWYGELELSNSTGIDSVTFKKV